MNIKLIIHTEDKSKLINLFNLILTSSNYNNFSICLHAKGYIPWEDTTLKQIITSFKQYYAYPTNKSKIESVVELVSSVKEDMILILDENAESFSFNTWSDKCFDFLYTNKTELLKLNLDTKYESFKWFMIDLLSQHKKTIYDYVDSSNDCVRYKSKIQSPIFNEKIIYIDGGMGDHVMALPLLERIQESVYVCCKYPFIYEHLKFKGVIDWNNELFGGYKRFVYDYGSKNKSKTIIDAFFDMYGYDRTYKDKLIYNGRREPITIENDNRKVALICSSAARIGDSDSNKNWENNKWFSLVNELRKGGYYVIQVGTDRDIQIPNVNLKFLDKTLSQLAMLIEMSELWISVDTFFHHFAASIKPDVGICLTPFYNDHAKHPKVKYIEKDCGKDFSDRKWWLDSQQPERKECMNLISTKDVLNNININRKKLVLIYSSGINDNCSNWRVYQQYDGFDDFEIIHKNVLTTPTDNDLLCDIVIFCRPVVNCLSFIKTYKQNGVKVIVDYDDAFPYANRDNPNFINIITEMFTILRECDLITTSTNNLKYYFGIHTNTECVVIPNIINPKFINDRKTDNGDKIVLGWYGSRGHLESVLPIKDVILRILDEFENVYLNIYTDNSDIYDVFKHEKTKYIPYNFNFVEFQDTIGDIDINLAPLLETYLNLHKSNIRIILPGYKGIPSVVSNFAEYKYIGKDNVLLCETNEDWYTNIKKLIQDKEFRNTLSKNIKEKVTKDYTFDSWKNNKIAILNELITGTSNTKKGLTWLAKFDDHSSMGILSQHLLENIKTTNISCKPIIGKTETKNQNILNWLSTTNYNDLGIMFAYPDSYNELNSFKTKVIYTGVDTTGGIPNFAENSNKADYLLTPSFKSKERMERLGVTKPIFVLPHGIDPQVFKYKPRVKSDKFKFLYVGECSDRKGIFHLLSAFVELFGDNTDVELHIKSNSAMVFYNGQDINYYTEKYKNIFWHISNEGHEKIIQLYNECHVYVYPSRADTFGMTLLEAMACGLPVISTSEPGATELIKGRYFDVKTTLTPVLNHPWMRGEWGEPNETQLKYYMSSLYNDYDNICDILQLKDKSDFVINNYSWEKIGKKFETEILPKLLVK